MNDSFWNSNLFQTLVLIFTIGAMFGVALWQFHAHKRKELRNAVSILMLQIKDIEQNVVYIYYQKDLLMVLFKKFHCIILP